VTSRAVGCVVARKLMGVRVGVTIIASRGRDIPGKSVIIGLRAGRMAVHARCCRMSAVQWITRPLFVLP